MASASDGLPTKPDRVRGPRSLEERVLTSPLQAVRVRLNAAIRLQPRKREKRARRAREGVASCQLSSASGGKQEAVHEVLRAGSVVRLGYQGSGNTKRQLLTGPVDNL